MPRQSRNEILSNAEFAHILVEGTDNQNIFKEKRSKEKYKSNIKKYSQKYAQPLIAYCIMENSAHMIFKINDLKKLSTCIKSINLSFSQLYNTSHNKEGMVFKSRFRSEALNNNTELIGCIAFIHSKPVETKKAIFAEQYLYSSSNDYALKQSDMIDFELVKQVFGTIPTIPGGTSIKFIDTVFEQNENIEKVLIEIVDRYNITTVESLKNDSLLYLICKELKVRTQCSLREIARRLNVSRERVRKLMQIKL